MGVGRELFWVNEGGWENILVGWGWVGKYFGWVGGGVWGGVHCLMMPI